MAILDILKKYPKTTFVMIDYGLHCIGCIGAVGETIEEAARVHQIDLDKFLADLNKVAQEDK